tara:strand:+ start:1141 stop:1422 length:282 start_codon:yes stop_codon:yes gene_type:complete
MIKPKLTNFADFIEKPKPVIPKTKYQVQQEINWYLNISIFLVIVIGLYLLYQRYKFKEYHEKLTQQKIKQFDEYLNEFYIDDMIKQSKNNNTM